MNRANSFFKLTKVLIFSLLLIGCQNPYAAFYSSTLTPAREKILLPYSGETKVFYVPPQEAGNTFGMMFKLGYFPIGVAEFQANARDYSAQLKATAQRVGADATVVSSEYAGNITGVIPLVGYSPSETASVTYSALHSTTSGFSHTAGSASIDTPGKLSVSNLPYTIHRSNYLAVFYRRAADPLGAGGYILNDEQRAAFGRNSGVYVVAIRDDSPAFHANILAGDILTDFDGETWGSAEKYLLALAAKANQEVTIGVIRNGAPLKLRVRFGPIPNSEGAEGVRSGRTSDR